MTTFRNKSLLFYGRIIFQDGCKVSGISQKRCVENKFRHDMLRIIHKNGLSTSAFLKSERNIIQSYCKDIVIPKNVPFHDFIWQKNVEIHGNKTALVDGITGTVYTYEQACSLSIRFGNGLRKRGFKKSDVLAVFLPNCNHGTIL